MSDIVSASDFLRPAQRRYCTVPLPDGRKVRIQSLTSGEMRRLRESLSDKKGDLNKQRYARLGYLLIAATVVDADGTKLFSEAQAMGPDFDAMDGSVVGTLIEYVKKFTGFVIELDLTAVEDEIKNCESGHAG